jgi:1-acyl-sn-glycerol-3-phosphate acyltransferase
MKTKPNSISRLLAFWFLGLFVLTFLLQFPLYFGLLLHKKLYPAAHRLRKAWGRFLFFGIGVRVVVEKESELDPKQAYVFCANHDSYIDIPTLAVVIPNFFGYMAKDELTRIPLFRRFFHTIDVAVDRVNRRQAHLAYLRASEKLKAGQSIAIFPEGGIIRGPAMLKPFKSGAFKLAVEHNIPIVPVSLIDSRYILPDVENIALFPGRSRVVVHAPIWPQANNERAEKLLRQATFDVIEKTLSAYHAVRPEHR